LDRKPVDADLALRQWDGYVAALAGEGWEVTEVPAAEDCPDSAFVEDTVVVYGDLAVISRPGAVERRPETAGTEQTLAGLGYRIARIEEPGTLDGGDVLKHDGTDRTVVGDGARVGSDTMLVAPVRVGKRAFTGAGSVITKDVPDGALGVERSDQVNIPGYADKREARARSGGASKRKTSTRTRAPRKGSRSSGRD
jgi:hypothetical protein